MRDAGHKDEFLEPLDISKWRKKDHLIVEHFGDLFTDLNPMRIEEHRAILPTIPRGIQDFEHLTAPATYSLLAYGRIGLTPLYKSSIENAHAASQ